MQSGSSQFDVWLLSCNISMLCGQLKTHVRNTSANKNIMLNYSQPRIVKLVFNNATSYLPGNIYRWNGGTINHEIMDLTAIQNREQH